MGMDFFGGPSGECDTGLVDHSARPVSAASRPDPAHSASPRKEESDWLDVVDDARAVRAIFGDHTPSLQDVDVFDLVMSREGPYLDVRFDLPEYPAEPPVKWAGNGANRVQLTLRAHPIRELSVVGIRWQMTATLTVQTEGDDILLSLVGDGIEVRALSESLSVQRVSAYTHDPASACP